MSSGMLAIFQVGRAKGIVGVIGAGLAEGSEPIRLQVIPYQVRNQEIPVLPFLLPPPPLLLDQPNPRGAGEIAVGTRSGKTILIG